MALFEQMRANVGKLLRGIDRYNPENLATLEPYRGGAGAKENAYDLEANLAVLKLYQFNPAFFQTGQEERPIRQILYLGELLETCHFQSFWLRVWMSKYGWTEPEPGRILISNQEENIKPKNIVEKIDFDSVSSIMASSL
ncbi:Eukaryotic translation initiation factor 3 subunit K [Lonchura striata]|uniref:Eukaryotic translation initiation factor 3 subunit K n=1 Tax=Lonchura striata TaxID=40157 RepID=A0A218UBK3_9PASE|nr:Eukaryotic translation initiation factor 3 subunit K [Lonchura striata domestica]